MGVHYQSYLGCSFGRCGAGVGLRSGASPDLTSGETPHWPFARFALQPSPERCAQASLVRTDKWIESRSVLEDTSVERFLLEEEDTLAPHEESVKGPNTLANMASPLPSSLDLIPVPRDERLSGPERDQLTAPCWAHEEGPERRSTSVVKPLPDCVSPHLELFLAQLAVPVRWAMRRFSSSLPSRSQSVWWPAFLRHVSHLLKCEHAISALSAGALGTTISAPSYNIVIFPPLCGAPSVGVSSPGGCKRVPFYRVGDVVAY